jgi:subtilisin family serine protease
LLKPRTKAGATLAAALATALSWGMASSAHGAPAPAPVGRTAASPSAQAALRGKATHTVTLITGDRVRVDAKGHVIRATPGKGREGTPISVRRYRGHTYAIPLDAAHLLAQGKLDRRLFDVTGLIADRYDDQHRSTIPLIVSHKGGDAAVHPAFAAGGLTVRRSLPVVHADAVTAQKSGAAEVWQALTTGSRMAPAVAAGVDRIWLDGVRHASDDVSDAQIGAPDAWKAGYTGKGVKIAVLDTGVDDTHPDLKGHVVAAKNFSDADNDVDHFGHGTHVASIATGSGAKSGGKYKGVAYDAKILAGKVLDDDGFGDDSGIIAGMQWAADNGAKIVNLSLGGGDTPEVDPVEQAVNDLSKSKGMLFAIAAGNGGPGAGTIGSPGSAAAALTVGAVDKKDALADFSSVGPTADGSLKPDITAPGVDIIAARAAHGVIGDPAGDGYVTLSGTSMATPHVAGAAALLAQQHPDWTGERIKEALVASAESHQGLSAFQQGTGRLDLTTAIKQSVVTEQTSLGFGVQQWPHGDDKPLTKTVTYRNTGGTPVVLDVSATGTGPGGKPAPAGMFTVDPAKVTVPAGGTADVHVTADTRLGSVDGAFSGALDATVEGGQGQVVHTALGVIREVESYNLTLKFHDNKGKPARADVTVAGLDTDYFDFLGDSDGDGTMTVRLPKGTYAIEGDVGTPKTGRDDMAVMPAPKTALTKDTTVDFDARKAKGIRITPPDAKAKIGFGTLDWSVEYKGNGYGSTWFTDDFTHLAGAHVGPALTAKEFQATVGGQWYRGTTTRWDLLYTRTGTFYTGFTHTTGRSELARVDVGMGEPAAGKTGMVGADWEIDGSGVGGGFGSVALPNTQTHYVTTPKGVKWSFDFMQMDAKGAMEADQFGRSHTYTAGHTYSTHFNRGVFGPAVGSWASYRDGDTFGLCPSLFTDGSGHVGDSAYSKARFTLTGAGRTFVDVKDVPCTDVAGVPLGRTTYTAHTDVTRSSKLSAVTTRLVTDWTFTSAKSDERLPLSVVRFTPWLSATSTAKAGAKFTVPLGIQGSGAAKPKSLSVKVSYDEGKTWHTAKVATVKGARVLHLTHPKTATSVSFQASLTDSHGNKVKETIYRAYRLVK